MEEISQNLKLYQRWHTIEDMPIHILFIEGKVEEEIANMFFPYKRHILFLPDLSDSCLAKEPEWLKHIEDMVNSTMAKLNPNIDIYSIYPFGFNEPLTLRQPVSKSIEFIKDFQKHIKEAAYIGTWLSPNLEIISNSINTDEFLYIFILTDGEIWDIDNENVKDSIKDILAKDNISGGICWLDQENPKLRDLFQNKIDFI